MTLLQSLLHLTNFKSSLLQTLVPSVSAVFAIQTTFAIPSIAAQSDRFFDFSGALTFVAVTTLSLYLPSLRTRYAAETLLSKPSPLPSLLALFRSDSSRGVPLNWRQVALTGAVSLWATRLGTYLFHRILQEGGDSRFDKIKIKPTRYAIAYTVQSVWICLCSMPVIAVNAIPSAAFPSRLRVMDVLGLSLYLGGFTLEVLADWQKAKWVRQRKEKVHDEQFLTRGLWSKSRHPNYFGESTLWVGIATTAAGVLLSRPVSAAMGLNPVSALSLSYVSPAFVTFLLLKVSGVPGSEKKYDKKFGERKEYQEWKKNTPKFFPRLW